MLQACLINKREVASRLELERVKRAHDGTLIRIDRGLHARRQVLADLSPCGLNARNRRVGKELVQQCCGVTVKLKLRVGVKATVVAAS